VVERLFSGRKGNGNRVTSASRSGNCGKAETVFWQAGRRLFFAVNQLVLLFSPQPKLLMQSTNCLNCGSVLEPSQRFCPQCGQNADTHRLNFKHIWHDLIHAFTHADKGIFSLMWQLAYRPGIVAREYVDGKRKKYFNPFTFIILVVGFASVILISSGFTNFGGSSRMPPNPIAPFLNRHINLLIFLNIPLLALFNRLLFRRHNTNYSENLVLAAFASGERSIFFSLFIAPVWVIFHPPFYPLLIFYLLCWSCYYGWASSQFYSGKKVFSFLKGVLSTLLTQVVTTILVSGAYIIYFKFFYTRH
jgi:Protein of unknown function (DUF3667)